MKRALTLLAVTCLCLGAKLYALEDGETAENPTLKPLHCAIAELVKHHYPEATTHTFENKIHFEHSTRLYVTRAVAKVPKGEEPPLVEERGPMTGGVWCDIRYYNTDLQDRPPYPRSEGVTEREYFTELIYYPNDNRNKCHMVVTLRLPSDLTKNQDQFIQEFRELLGSFGKQLPSQGS